MKISVSIPVDADTAMSFAEASPEDRQKLELLLGLRLRELIERPARPLCEIMDEIGGQAAAQGMTPETLNELLRNA